LIDFYVENYTAQELMARNIYELHYWTSSSTAEVDFILPFEEQILPLEVKAGLSKKTKSLKVYDDKFKPPFLIRTSLMNFKQDGHICNYPLYGVGIFPAGLPLL
jgi:hypothetical protein